MSLHFVMLLPNNLGCCARDYRNRNGGCLDGVCPTVQSTYYTSKN